MSAVHLIEHALVTAKMSRLRDKNTSAEEFRRALEQIAVLLLGEVAKDWALVPEDIETPLAKCAGAKLARPIVFAPILRAGLGLLEGMARVMPEAAVGHIGLYRDEQTLRPVKYYCRLPRQVAAAQIVLLDPMLATGHSACAALALLKEQGATAIQFACVVACNEGIAQVASLHPEVPIFCAAIDPRLNEVGYIVPGLGDAGDRYFGTT